MALHLAPTTADITGVLFWGHKVCVECKDTKKRSYLICSELKK